MEAPKNKGELKTILETVNYLSKFAPCLSAINVPLCQLLKESSEFVWDAQQEQTFSKIKELIIQEPGPVLIYFDPAKQLKLQVDASKYRLGIVLLKDSKPVSYASKSLTDSEVKNAQIEKKLYAILFGFKCFHHYVYGQHVIVESDHKLLKSIMKKTRRDTQLTVLQRVIQDGWPEERKTCPQVAAEFWNDRDELFVINGIAF